MSPAFNNAAPPRIDPHLRQRLFVAAKRGDTAALKLILKANPGAEDWRQGGKSVLQAAVEKQQVASVDTLLQAHADVNAASDDGTSSPMIAAARSDDTFMLVKLIHAQGRVHDVNGGDTTPLMNAVRHDAAKAVQVLLTHGASRTQQDDDHNGPLHVATSMGKFKAAEALLKGGVDINARNGETLTPLMLAAKEINFPAYKFLVDHGADETLVSDLRETAKDMVYALAAHDADFMRGYDEMMRERRKRETEAYLPQMQNGADRAINAPAAATFRRRK